MSFSYVYRHIRLDRNEPFYIGVGTDHVGRLPYRRAFSRHERSRFWKSVVNLTDYEVEILTDYMSFEEALVKEKEFIKLYGRRDLGTGCLVNMTEGGDGAKGAIVSEETRRRLREASKNRQPISEETRQRLKKAAKYRTFSTEAKAKQLRKALGSKHRVGKLHSEETRAKMSEAWKTRPAITEETRNRMRAANAGKPWSDSRRQAYLKSKADV